MHGAIARLFLNLHNGKVFQITVDGITEVNSHVRLDLERVRPCPLPAVGALELDNDKTVRVEFIPIPDAVEREAIHAFLREPVEHFGLKALRYLALFVTIEGNHLCPVRTRSLGKRAVEHGAHAALNVFGDLFALRKEFVRFAPGKLFQVVIYTDASEMRFGAFGVFNRPVITGVVFLLSVDAQV